MEIGGTGIRNVGDDKDDFSSSFCFALLSKSISKGGKDDRKFFQLFFNA